MLFSGHSHVDLDFWKIDELTLKPTRVIYLSHDKHSHQTLGLKAKAFYSYKMDKLLVVKTTVTLTFDKLNQNY
jgi:hypothetical protein